MTPPPAKADAGSLRCFLALLPDPATREVLSGIRAAPANSGANARGRRWVDATALHLTLRFLGATTATQADFIQHMLPTLARELPAIAPQRCAIWPNRARPRLLVLEITAEPTLLLVAQACEALACKAGFTPDPRAFRPHMTLARLRPGCALDVPAGPAARVAFASIALMASDLAASGARYRSLASAALVSQC